MSDPVSLAELSSPVPPEFLGMTFARYRERLAAPQSGPHTLALGLWCGLVPAGLGVAEVRGESAELLSLFVVPEFQGRGAGFALLNALERVLAVRGVREAEARFNTELPGSAALTRLLARQQWTPPEMDMRFVQVGSSLGGEAWLRETQLPDGELFSWSELTTAERGQLERDRAHFPAALWPFDAEQSMIEPLNSLGLRLDGSVIGYLITHRVGPTTIRYTSLFVRDFGSRRLRAERTFALLAEGIRRQYTAHGEAGVGALAVRVENGPMLRVLERRVLPHARAVHEWRIARKLLAAPAVESQSRPTSR